MNDGSSRFATVAAVFNTTLGTILLISATFLLTFAVLGMSENAGYLDGAIMAAGGILGVWSGIALIKRLNGRRTFALAFAAALVCIETVLFLNGRFSVATGVPLLLYAVASGYFAARKDGFDSGESGRES